MSETLRQWLTPPQLAKQLRIEPPKVIAWINRGELRSLSCRATWGG